jgi:hypothetical protein
MNQEVLDRESDMRDRVWKYVFGLAIVLALAALPHSRIQDALRIGTWSAGFLGLVLVYVWPFLIDRTSILVVSAISLFHCLVVALAYSRLPQHGYLGIGLVAVVELVICALPIAWLGARSEDVRTKRFEQINGTEE